MFFCTPAMVVPVVLPTLPPLPLPHCPSCRHRHCHWHTAHHVTLGSCMSFHTVVLPTSPLLPAVSPSGGCMSCCAVVLPALPLPPLPAHCLSCCHWAVAHRAALVLP